jgi:hypothetical protein
MSRLNSRGADPEGNICRGFGQKPKHAAKTLFFG